MIEVDLLDRMALEFNHSAVALIPYKFLGLINTETNHLRVGIILRSCCTLYIYQTCVYYIFFTNLQPLCFVMIINLTEVHCRICLKVRNFQTWKT